MIAVMDADLSLLSFCSSNPCTDVCSSSQNTSVVAKLPVCCDKSISNIIYLAFMLLEAKTFHLCSLHRHSVPDWCHIWTAIYVVWCPRSQSDPRCGRLTPWPLPGNWDCCSVIQFMERSCRGLHGKRGEEIVVRGAGGKANDPGWT